MSPDDLEHFIQERLPVAAVAGVPEIRLHLAGPTSGLSRLHSNAPPYWARVWGGGLALARHVLDHPETVAGRRVLDLGCGGGLVGIAAALAGADVVFATDLDPRAVVASRMNASLNGVRLSTSEGDIDPSAIEVVLAGDVFYDAETAERSTAALDAWAAEGASILVGDPWRVTLPTARLRKLADYPVTDFGNAEAKPAAVFAWSLSH